MKNIVDLSKNLMQRQTRKNKAPSWLLTEIAINKGEALAKKYKTDKKLVLTSLYLSHIIFNPVWKGSIQKNHPAMSADFAKKYLNKWQVSKNKQEIILDSIRNHHNKTKSKSKVAEIVKNAECFKFVTLEGALIFLHDLGKRNISFDEASKRVLTKMKEKKGLLTLNDCKKEAEKNCKEILKIFK